MSSHEALGSVFLRRKCDVNVFQGKGGKKVGGRYAIQLTQRPVSQNTHQRLIYDLKKSLEISLLKNVDWYKGQGHPVKNHNTSSIITQRRSYVLKEKKRSFCY